MFGLRVLVVALIFGATGCEGVTPGTLALAILSLGFLIVVHEGGHYFVARWCRMRIERFSIGFGPGLLKWKSKTTHTTFQLAPIPFGGFVEIRGMNIAEEVDPEDRFAYPNRPAWQRFLTIFAGPATNYLSAIFLAFGIYNCHGMESSTQFHVDHAIADYDAFGKVAENDHIVAVNGTAMWAPSAVELAKQVKASEGKPMTLTIWRGMITFNTQITPKLVVDPKTNKPVVDETDGKALYRLGIASAPDLEALSVGESAGAALKYPVIQTQLIGHGLYEIIFGSAKADPGGPKRIVEEFSKAFDAGILQGIKLLATLSVYLGLFNLFPLPALDGGRLVFLLYEMVTRRRANPKIEATVHMAGIMVLGVVMVLVTLHDFHVF